MAGKLYSLLRGVVSGDRNRYVSASYDLDLTYITDRLIGKFFIFI